MKNIYRGTSKTVPIFESKRGKCLICNKDIVRMVHQLLQMTDGKH